MPSSEYVIEPKVREASDLSHRQLPEIPAKSTSALEPRVSTHLIDLIEVIANAR